MLLSKKNYAGKNRFTFLIMQEKYNVHRRRKGGGGLHVPPQTLALGGTNIV